MIPEDILQQKLDDSDENQENKSTENVERKSRSRSKALSWKTNQECLEVQVKKSPILFKLLIIENNISSKAKVTNQIKLNCKYTLPNLITSKK